MPMDLDLSGKLRTNLSKHKLISNGDRLIVGVSGGADSVALLLSLFEIRHDQGLEIVVAHYDHALRKSSARDQVFVKALALRLGLRFVTGRNRRRVPKKGSIEEFAREQRYDFLLELAGKIKADAVALAHTQDDLAETVLMRILRGTGLSGLRSMTFKSCRRGVTLIRPFLNISRREIEGYLKARKARFVNDPTNRCLDFTRNRVRLKLIPFLATNFVPDIKDRLASLSETVALDYDFLDQSLKKIYRRITDGSQVHTSSYTKLHPSMRRMLLRTLLEKMRPGCQALSLKHIDMMDAFMTSSVQGQMVLPGGLRLLKKRNKIKLISLTCEVGGLSLE